MCSIDSGKVDKIMQDCLLTEKEVDRSGEKPEPMPGIKTIRQKGVKNTFVLHHERLQKYAKNVKEMLLCLPELFMENGGGGYSFLGACNDKDGNQWTDLHYIMECLLVLGMALGMVKELTLPGIPVSMMPGGMPYYVVLNDERR